MSRNCELTGKSVSFGHRVSHSQRKTNRKFKPNLHKLSLMSVSLNNSFSFKISANALRTIDKKGGLDEMLLDANYLDLSIKARKIRKKLLDKVAE